ncbi:MAG TPA: hypothetical protein VK766_00860 [Cytophagaceae bacterium]|jgi:hypothetical protein|nr:hypothetical protein [Cytophagaceae bacterium]
MYVKFLTILVVTFFISHQIALAQEEEEEAYVSESIFGINLNTNGGLIGGLMFRHSKQLKGKRYLNLGVECVNVKHPNEVRTSDPNSGSIYILGKKNYLIALRPQIGYEFKLFSKNKEDGIQINALINGGPSIGLVKPYYIEFNNGTSVQAVPYDPNLYDPSTINGSNVVGAGSFFDGIGKTKIVPGLHVKAGLSFEFGSYGSGAVTGIEMGFLLEAYAHKIDILEISSTYPTYNRSAFSSLYVNIYFGGRH